jgi:hypothetical protein
MAGCLQRLVRVTQPTWVVERTLTRLRRVLGEDHDLIVGTAGLLRLSLGSWAPLRAGLDLDAASTLHAVVMCIETQITSEPVR